MSAAFEIGSADQDARPLGGDHLAADVDWVIRRARRSLLALQHVEGYWNAALEAPAQMNAEFIIFNHFMGSVDRELEARIARFLVESQQRDGSWNLFPGGEGYASYTIEAYAALKLAGMSARDEPLCRARSWIAANGGIGRAGTLARFYLAAIGQVPWTATASSPVELMLAPKWFPLNIYALGSWARGTFVALAMLQAAMPVVRVDARRSVAELFNPAPQPTEFPLLRGARRFSARNLLNLADGALRFYDRHHLKSLRARALREAEQWLLRHQEANGSFGGIEPCYLLSPMALKAIGYSNEHPVLRDALKASRELVWEMGDKALYMPCVSPNWNTVLACRALLASGVPRDHPALTAAVKWFIDHQIFKRGDWSMKRPKLPPGGWSFEFFNDAYPDIDDSAVDPDGAGAKRVSRRGGAAARAHGRSGLGYRDAVARRRFRRVRRRHQRRVAQSVAAGGRRSRHRSLVSGSDRTSARNDGRDGLSRGPSGGARGQSDGSSARSRRKARGGDDGASITSTELSPPWRDFALSAPICASHGSQGRSPGSRPNRTGTADGVKARSATRIRAGADADRAPPRRPRGR